MKSRNRKQVSDAVAALWERRKDEVIDRVAGLETAARTLAEGTGGEGVRQEAERESHRLVGSIGSFGFAEGSRLAREIERMFQAEAPLGQEEAQHLSELAAALRGALEQPRSAGPSGPAQGHSQPPG